LLSYFRWSIVELPGIELGELNLFPQLNAVSGVCRARSRRLATCGNTAEP
jgi:hypothetical protein